MACFWTDTVEALEICPGVAYRLMLDDVASLNIQSGNDTCLPDDYGGAWPIDIDVEVHHPEGAEEPTLIGSVDSFTLDVVLTEMVQYEGEIELSRTPIAGPGFSYSIAGSTLTITALNDCPPDCYGELEETVEITAQTVVGEVVSTLLITFFKTCF